MIDERINQLIEKTYKANMNLAKSGLVILTWGNVSSIDRELGLVAIKPSGVPYETMKKEDIVVVNLKGEKVYGTLNPSSDTPTHLALYRAFKEIGGICHTHSINAVSFAQAGVPLTCYGTTHADTFYGNVPVTRDLKEEEIKNHYEENTAKVILEAFEGINPLAIPGVLVKSHGPFTWGETPQKAVDNSLILETDAKMAILSKQINPSITKIDQTLLDKHYLRKHGKNAYYGQKKGR